MANKPENLKPFKKGQSGNPKGRPVGVISITSAIKRRLAEKAKDGRTHLEHTIDVIVEKANKEKDYSTLKTIWNYIDGMPIQKMQGNFKIEKPIYEGKSTIQGYEGNEENIQPDQENKGGSRRDISEQDD